MADIDRQRLSADVTAFLDARGYSYRDAVFVWPALNPAMLSRAASGQVLSAGNLLALCQAFGLDPFVYVTTGQKAAPNPAVTAIDTRETLACRHGGAIKCGN